MAFEDKKRKKEKRKKNGLFSTAFGDMKLKGAFAGLKAFPGDATIQAKLEISSPVDIHEQQADEIARKVVNGGDASMEITASPHNIMTQSNEGGSYANESMQSDLDSTKGEGKELDKDTREEMESCMGADLGDVRIHTGSKANEMSESINAKAFTHGQDIYFRNGNYDPVSNAGKELLAHELAHTLQQSSTALRPRIQRTPTGDPVKGVITISVAVFYKEPKESADPNLRHPDLHLEESVEIIEYLPGGWTKVRRREGENILEGYVRTVFVIEESKIPEIHPRLLSKEEIDSYYEKIRDELDIDWLPPDFIVTDKEVTNVLTWFKELYDTGDTMAFIDVAMRIRGEGLLEKPFFNMNETHIKNNFFIISRLAVLLSPEALIRIADWQVKIEGGEEVIKGSYRAGKKLLKDILQGFPRTRDYTRTPTANNKNPIDTNAIKQKGIDLIKSMIGDRDKFILEVDSYVTDFLNLKYYQIAYLAKDDRKAAIPELEGLLDLNDAMLEFLIADTPTHPFITGTLFDYIFSAWDTLKTTPVANAIKISDSTNKETPLAKLMQQNTTKPITGSSGNTGNAGPAPALQLTNDDTKQLKDMLKELVVNEAERVHNSLYMKFFPLFAEDTLLLKQTNRMLRRRRKKEYKMLSEGVKIRDYTKQEYLAKYGSLDKMTWIDLTRIWFYELGPQNLSSKKDPLVFGENAWTTKQLKEHPNMKQLSNYAIKRASENELEGFTANIEYGTDAFYQSIVSRDTVMIFLGSFFVDVTFDQPNRKIIFTAYNESSLESGSRFRRNPDAPAGSQANKIGMLESKDRGQGAVPIGGTLYCRWVWSEKF